MSERNEVYVVIGYQGEWSNRQVWVAGVYTDKALATTTAETHKSNDRKNWVVWSEWCKQFGKRLNASGKHYRMEDRAALAQEFGLDPEPTVGSNDSEYTVACVPLNTPGVWDYA